MRWRRALAALLVGSLATAAAGCDRGRVRDGGGPAQSSQPTPRPEPGARAEPAAGGAGDSPAVEVKVPPRRRGGSARVGVWAAPDPAAETLGGSAVRALVLPQLFVVRPDGRWSPALVAPRSDRLAADRRSAEFRLRAGATWSDGTPITVEDLRRSADARFVAGLEGPSADGIITVRFTQELPGWRRLWSGTDSIAPPAPGVWGGPFVVASMTPGLETVLRRNDRWWVAGAPFLDEVRLVLVPDPTTARLLLGRGELDVVMPPAGTARTPQLERLPGVSVEASRPGGWFVVMVANPGRLNLDDRKALFAILDRSAFVATLLAGEALPSSGFAGPEDGIWSGAKGGDSDAKALKGDTIDLVGLLEEPMTYFLHRSMQRQARGASGRIELRQAEADRVERWLREGQYGAAIVFHLDPPGGCWRCRWEHVDAGLSAAADAGDAAAITALEIRLRDEALALPLWEPVTVAAWIDGLHGPQANGFAASAAWNAWEWWRAG